MNDDDTGPATLAAWAFVAGIIAAILVFALFVGGLS